MQSMPDAGVTAEFAQAERFLALFTGAGNGLLTFQTFDDTAAKRPRLAKIFQGTLKQHFAKLKQLNAEGAGVFFMVNQGDGYGRRATNVARVRALFVDLDGAPLDPVLNAAVPPHAVVQSSPGRWHTYWIVEDIELDAFGLLQEQLARKFNGDRTVKDLPRVMRLPGFAHRKNGSTPTILLSISDAAPLQAEAVYSAFDLQRPIRTGERNNTLFRAASGFKQAGVPQHRAVERAKKLNLQACAIPLDVSEVSAVVDQAYRYPARGFSMVPYTLVDSWVFGQLSASAAKLLLCALRRQLPGRDFSLIHSDFAHMRGFTNRQAFRAAMDELLQVGLLTITRPYISGVDGKVRQCALYRIPDWVQTVPKA